MNIEAVSAIPVRGSLVAGRADNPIEMYVKVNGSGVGVAGQNLWTLSSYGSQNRRGTGRKYAQTMQILTPEQQNTMLIPGTPMELGRVSMNIDMTNQDCNQVTHVCLTLGKGQDPTTVFSVVPVPNSNVLTKCIPYQCAGRFLYVPCANT